MSPEFRAKKEPGPMSLAFQFLLEKIGGNRLSNRRERIK